MNHHFTKLGLLIVLVLTLAVSKDALARREQPDRTRSGRAIAADSHQDSVVRAFLIKGRRLVLDDTLLNLSKVQQTLGKTTLLAPRNHGDLWSVCYSGVDSTGPFTIRLQSNELGGLDHVVLGFELTREPKAGNCASLGVVYDAKTDNGLYLGMPVAALLSIMGRPVRSSRGEYSFEFYEVHEPTRDPTGKTTAAYENTASLDVKTANGRVVRLSAWYVGRT